MKIVTKVLMIWLNIQNIFWMIFKWYSRLKITIIFWQLTI